MYGTESKELMKKNNKGFTLVEMIIVLVILAILAAILIPALLGYIDEAKEKQDVLDVKNVLQATQAELAKSYAKAKDIVLDNQCVIEGGKLFAGGKGNGDVDATNTKFAANVLELAGLSDSDNKPWLLMIGIGSNYVESGSSGANNDVKKAQKSMTLHDRYTVYYALYIKDKESKPLYFYNGEWTKENPRAGDKDKAFNNYNVALSGPLKGKRLQYYVLSFNETKSKVKALDADFWKCIKENGGKIISDLWK